jgi:hypothetical protein
LEYLLMMMLSLDFDIMYQKVLVIGVHHLVEYD